MDHLHKTKKEYKNLKKQKIREVFIKTNQIQLIYRDFKTLAKITAFDKILHDKAFNIDKNSKYDSYQRDLSSMVFNFFNKKTSDKGYKNENTLNKELAEELYKPIIRKRNKKGTITFYRQYLGCRPSRYTIHN